MDPEQKQLLSLSLLPARLDAHQAAVVLGFRAHDINTLITARLLIPLGRPSPNSTKYFATTQLVQLREDIKWLSKATDAVQTRWRRKNHTEPPLAVLRQHPKGNGRPVPPAHHQIETEGANIRQQ